MKKYAVAAAIVAASMSTPVLAQAGPVSGPRLEATVGWDDVVLHVDGSSAAKSGVTYGGELGYDFQFSTGGVAGVYVGADGSSTSECYAAGTESLCVQAGRNFTAGVRVGGAIRGNSLVYAKAGYSNGRIDGSYTDSALPANNGRGKEDMDGFHVGAGAEVGLSHGVYGKAEYNYTRYSTYDLGGIAGRFDRHRVLGGVGYRF